jgi:hypothetical protein
MKEMTRYDGNQMEIGWISKLRLNKWLDMVEMAWKSNE